MSMFKCKMCGGALEVNGNDSVGTCEYCGTKQTLPTAQDEVLRGLFNRANVLRMKSEFDKASELYEKLVQAKQDDAEAYWGLILCKYGIEYVEDPATFRRVPTCHRTSFDSIIADEDYKSALQYADAAQRFLYEAEAKEIDRLQKEIITLSQKEEPYDVFICYKETDADGHRTPDSVIANDIYHQLTAEGFKVFYAAISLEDKLGSAYEPYIFAALNSAKVMLAVGTKPEYFNAVWVKNEWSRYLKMMKTDRAKLLIPCYKDMDAYELPEEFAHLQAQDMGKIGFINDVVRGIKKVIMKDGTKETKTEPVIVNPGVSSAHPLVERGYMALEDGEWAKADDFFEQALNMDAKNGDAYLGKFLAEEKKPSFDAVINAHLKETQTAQEKAVPAVKRELETEQKIIDAHVIEGFLSAAELKKLFVFDDTVFSQVPDRTTQLNTEKDNFDSNKNLSRALQYGAKGIREKLDVFYGKLTNRVNEAKEQEKAAIGKRKAEYAEFLKSVDARASEMQQKAEDKREEVYQSAVSLAEKAKTDGELQGVYTTFLRFGNYKDSEEYRDELMKKRERLEEQTVSKRKKTIAVIVISIVTSIILIILLVTTIIPAMKYNKAVKLMNEQEYDAAIYAFEEIYEFKDSKDLILQCNYDKAIIKMDSGYFAQAAMLFNTLGKYRDARDLAEQCFGKSGQRNSISAGCEHSLGLKKDGTVIATCYNSHGKCNVSNWSNIIAVSAGYDHSLGLTTDGRVDRTIINDPLFDEGQSDVTDWTDIVAISAGWYHSLGLKKDGTVVATEIKQTYAYDHGQSNVSNWKDIVAVSAGWSHSLGLKMDGTVISTGDNTCGQCNISEWKDIVSISAGSYHSLGLKSDGTVVAVGDNDNGQCNVAEWNNIIAISAGRYHSLGLKVDGTVVATDYIGDNYAGQCDVSEWTDIVAISAGCEHSLGIKANGMVLATDFINNHLRNYYQGDVSDWVNIKIPSQ